MWVRVGAEDHRVGWTRGCVCGFSIEAPIYEHWHASTTSYLVPAYLAGTVSNALYLVRTVLQPLSAVPATHVHRKRS